MPKKLDKETLIRYLLIVAIILIGGAAFALFYDKVIPQLGRVFSFVMVLLSPFIIAWLVAVITRPLNQLMINKLHFPPTLAVLLMMLVVFTLIALLIALVISMVSGVIFDLSHYIDSFSDVIEDINVFISQLFDKLDLDFSEVGKYIDQLLAQIGDWATQGLGMVLNIAKSTPGAIVLVFVAIVAVFYWCRDEIKVRNGICNVLPRKYRNNMQNAYDNISNVIGQYVRAQLILITISFAICTLGFTFIGAGSPLTFGIFAAILDIIPVLGPGTLIVPWAIWSFVTGEIGFGIALLVIYVINSAVRYILEPKIVGDKVGLHPLAALAAIFIGMKLFGIVGLILGPIILAIIAAAFRGRRQRIIIDPNGDGTPPTKEKFVPQKDKDKSKREKNKHKTKNSDDKESGEASPPDADTPRIVIR